MSPTALQPPVLLAAGLDWLEAILPILFVGFWILSQVFAVLRRVGGGPARPPVVRVPDAPRADGVRPGPPPAPAAGPREELEQQIAEFLRQVTGEKPGVERPPRAQPKPQPTTPLRPRPQAARPPRQEPATPAAQAPRPVSTLATGPSAVARHVHDAFSHELGHLHSGLEAAADEPAKAAPARAAAVSGLSPRDLVAAARDPATIRQAILLREILDRPSDRWE